MWGRRTRITVTLKGRERGERGGGISLASNWRLGVPCTPEEMA